MIVYDFEYDGIRLSDMGFMVGCFKDDGLKTESAGSELTFNTKKTMNGYKYELTSATYDSCLQTKFTIVKNVCSYRDSLEISLSEFRKMMRWLNRKRFYEFRVLNNEYADIYFYGSFNIEKVELDNKLYGLDLTLTTDRPFGLLNERKYILKANGSSNILTPIYDESDEIGYVYPSMKITVGSVGDDGIYSISNSIEPDRVMKIENCREGEIITVEYPIISSSIPAHDINKDFNWVFLRIANTLNNRKNIINATNGEIELTYIPIAKVFI